MISLYDPFAADPFCGDLDQKKPIARGLIDAFVFLNSNANKTFRNLANPTRNGTITGTPACHPKGIYVTGGASFDYTPNFPSVLDFAIRIVLTPVTWPGAFTTILDQTSRQASFFVDTSGNISYASAITIGTPATGMVVGKRWDFVVTRNTLNATAGTTDTYVNGKLLGTVDVSGTLAFTQAFKFGTNPSTGGSNADAIYEQVQLWSRGLRHHEVQQLYVEPFAWMLPRKRGSVDQVAAGTTPYSWWAWNQFGNQGMA